MRIAGSEIISCQCATHPTVRAMAFAVSILCMHAPGDAISPVIIGAVSDRSSLQSAVMLVPLAFALAAVLWSYGARTLPAQDT